MPKSNRLLHGIRDGITSYQRICTLHPPVRDPSNLGSTEPRRRGTIPGPRRARTMHVRGGNTRIARAPNDITVPPSFPAKSLAECECARWTGPAALYFLLPGGLEVSQCPKTRHGWVCSPTEKSWRLLSVTRCFSVSDA